MPTKKKPTAKSAKPRTVDDYLAGAPKTMRATLTRLRRTIKAAAPTATEGVMYGIAGYKYAGRYVVYFGYWKSHVALYGTSGRFIKAHTAELKPYVRSKGTIQFPAGKPLPFALVTRIVKDRMAQLTAAKSLDRGPAT